MFATSPLSSYSWQTFHDPKVGCVFSLIWSFIFVFVGNDGITGGRGGSSLTRPKKVMKTTLCHGQLWPQLPPQAQDTCGSPLGPQTSWRLQWKLWATPLKKTHIPTRVCWAVRASGEHSHTLRQEASFLGESTADQNLGDSEDKEACPASITKRLARTGCRQQGLSKLGSGRRKHEGGCERARDAQLSPARYFRRTWSLGPSPDFDFARKVHKGSRRYLAHPTCNFYVFTHSVSDHTPRASATL